MPEKNKKGGLSNTKMYSSSYNTLCDGSKLFFLKANLGVLTVQKSILIQSEKKHIFVYWLTKIRNPFNAENKTLILIVFILYHF